MTLRGCAAGGSCLGGVFFGFALLSVEHMSLLWKRPHYQFFPFVLAAFLYLVRQRWPSFSSPRRCSHRWGTLAVLCCTLSQAVAVWLNSPWLSTVNGILLLSAWCLMSRGLRSFMSIAPVWMLLWLLVPLPLQWDTFLIDGMQTLSVRVSSGVADLLGQNHLVQGHTIRIPGQLLLVDEACSGVQSLFATLAMVSVFSVWKRRALVAAGFLLASTFVWVGLVNVTRIVTIVVVNSQTSCDLSVGWPHDLLAMSLFPMTALLILATDRLLRNLLAPINATDSRLADIWDHVMAFPPVGLPPEAGDHRVYKPGRCVVGCCMLLGIWAVCLQISSGMSDEGLSVQSRLGTELKQGSLPDKLSGWTQTGFQTGGRSVTGAEGEYSHTWNYRLGRQSSAVSFDYPYRGWHPLEVCYEARGWTVSRRVTHGEPNPYWVECLLRRSSGEYAVLCYRMFHENGASMMCPGETLTAMLGNRFADVLGPRRQRMETFQFQMFVQHNTEPTLTERKAIRRGFEQFSDVIRKQVYQVVEVMHE